MKTLIMYFGLVLVAGTCYSQQITELKEAKVGFAPLSSKVDRTADGFSYKVNENYAQEFESDPLAFMASNFDINNLIAEVKPANYDTYRVSFKSTRGQLHADFDHKGELMYTKSVFKDILLPAELREQLYRENKGWVMVKNIRTTRGRNGLVKSDLFKIKLENGKDRKSIVYNGSVKDLRVAEN